MAANQHLSIKILVDKAKNRVLYAETSHDFVDLLFSFLTLPLGTITRLLRHHPQSSFCELGCINKLYDSVNDLSASHLRTEACKKMLLCPDRASEEIYKKLKLNLEGRKHRELYLCGKFSADCMLSAYYGVRCSCGLLTTQSAYLEEPTCVSRDDGVDVDGVFVKGARGERYIVSDDLQVMVGSISTCMFLLDKLGIGDDVSKIEERIVTVRLQEVLQLIRRSWCSKTILTDVFLSNQEVLETEIVGPRGTIQFQEENAMASSGKKFRLKLVQRRLTNEILYAEADHEFIDQLFSFLTFPLGSVFSFFGGKCFSKGSILNVYTSVMELSTNGFLKSGASKELLLYPKLAPFFSCENQILSIEEDALPIYNCTQKSGNGWKLFVLTEVDAASSSNSRSDGNTDSSTMDGLVLSNPKSTIPEDKSGGGFVKGPTKFMVTDDLVVTPLSHTSCLFFLKRLNVPYNDIQERVLDVGEDEVLNLLRASLISDTALSILLEGEDDSCLSFIPEIIERPKRDVRKPVKTLTISEIHKILGTKESKG